MPQTEQFYSALKLLKVPDGDGSLQRGVARHDVAAVELHAHAAVSAATGSRSTRGRRRSTTTRRSNSSSATYGATETRAHRGTGDASEEMRRILCRAREHGQIKVSASRVSVAVRTLKGLDDTLACCSHQPVSRSSTAAQSPVDLGTISRIKQEALTRSQAMDHVGWMSDVYGPRVTGTPNFQRASEWAMKRFTEWGLANVHQERFAFGQGWRVERFSAHMIAPEPQPIIGYPRTFSPSTKGTISGDVVRVDIRSRGGLREVQGQAQRQDRAAAGRTRRVRMLEDRIVLRMNEEDIAEALTTPIPAATGARCAGAPVRRCGRSAAQRTYRAVLRRPKAWRRCSSAAPTATSSAGGSDLSWQTQRVDGGTIFPGGGGSRDPKDAGAGAVGDDCRRALQPHGSHSRQRTCRSASS